MTPRRRRPPARAGFLCACWLILGFGPTLAAAPEVTGSIAPKQQDRPPVVAGWIIREVFDGRAVIEHDRLGFYEVVPGANLPGIGRVETIKRQDGRWVVVTPKGLILSQRVER